MNIDAIKNGIVIDHITAGKAMEIYSLLGLDKLECSVAIIKNVQSKTIVIYFLMAFSLLHKPSNDVKK